ncbi:MAG: DUF305 domain-containing protein [Coleofasciculaceae cyanobacterium SM2_1_6]|nr:DUF305 domain-containing protein [Coleofasciculaceae cyanobacterium SM2_1_6]
MQFPNRKLVILLGLMGMSFGAIAACTPNSNNASSTQSNQIVSSSPDTPTGKQDQGQNQDHMGMDHSMAMDLGPADADYDLRFIDGMILHHQGAVVMAEAALEKSTRPELKKLATEIIAAQKQEIAQMQAWRTSWYANAPSTPMGYSASMGHMMAMSQEQMNSMMMSGDLGAADAQFDLRFIKAMIPHHEGALVMAKDALEKSARPEIKQLAQAILSSQAGEISQMQQWRKDWYNQ